MNYLSLAPESSRLFGLYKYPESDRGVRESCKLSIFVSPIHSLEAPRRRRGTRNELIPCVSELLGVQDHV